MLRCQVEGGEKKCNGDRDGLRDQKECEMDTDGWMCCRGFAAKSRLHVAEQAPKFWCGPGAPPGHFQARGDLDGTGLDGTGRDAKQQVSFVCFANIRMVDRSRRRGNKD